MFLFLSACPLAFSVSESGDAVLLAGRRLPGTCSVRARTGKDCPTCGLTRSVVSIARGELDRAWRFHPGGFLFYAYALAQLALRLALASSFVPAPDWRLDTALSLGAFLAVCTGWGQA